MEVFGRPDRLEVQNYKKKYNFVLTFRPEIRYTHI